MSQPAPEINTASQRHWMYGINAGFLVVIGLVVVAFLFYFGNRSRASSWASFDWTSSGVNSLSGSTKRLLTEIADRKQTYRLYNLYPSRSDIEKRDNRNAEQDEHRQKVLDLLNEYARRSSNITVEDMGDRPADDIQRQIRDLYKTELKPYEDAIAEFDPLAKKLMQFIEDQADKIGAAGQKVGSAPRDVQLAGSIQAAFQSLPDDIDSLKRAVKKEKDSTLPRWGRVRDTIVSGLTDSEIITIFSTLADKDKVKELPTALATYFTNANDEYKAIYSELSAYKDKLAKLPPLKVDDVLESLRRNSVAILGADSAKVVSDTDIFADVPNPNGGTAGVSFNGEQAISSALFAMVRPDKVKVVFIGLPAGGGMYNEIKDVLKGENFDPLEWSPPAPPTPDGPPPSSPEPPAMGKGVVWIIFPPEGDPQMAAMGMAMPGNPQPIIDATKRHLAAGGQALFLAETSAAPNPMMGASAPTGYPYDALVREFGINVQSKYTVVNYQEGTNRDTGAPISQASPYIPIDRFEDHEITRPIQSLPTIFGPARTQSAPSMVTVVDLQSSMPTGVEGKVIVKSPSGTDYFATASPFSSDVKFQQGTDLPGPVPLAAVAVKNKGQKDKDGNSTEQRIAVFGSKQFAADMFLEYPQAVMIGGQPAVVPRFPGNSELMKNTVLWLAGYENMIAVSAKANQGSRIGNVPPAQLAAVRFLIAGGIPVAALLLGGIVWSIRRR